jgi:hypothetical protein
MTTVEWTHVEEKNGVTCRISYDESGIGISMSEGELPYDLRDLAEFVGKFENALDYEPNLEKMEILDQFPNEISIIWKVTLPTAVTDSIAIWRTAYGLRPRIYLSGVCLHSGGRFYRDCS